MRNALLWLLVSFSLPLAAQDRELEELLKQARNLRSAGKLEESAASYSRVLEQDPRNVTAYLGRAHTRRAQKDFAGARADLESAQKLEPGTARVLYGFGLLHSDLKDYDAAAQFFQRGISADPKYCGPYSGLGLLANLRKDYSAAERVLTQAIACDPMEAGNYNLRGVARRNLNNREGAAADFERVLELDPSHQGAKKNLAALTQAPVPSLDAARHTAPTPAPLPSRQQAPVPRPPSMPPAAFPAFPAGDACAAAGSASPDVPWQHATVAPLPATDAAPASIPPFVDINRLTPAQWSGTVMAASAAMRLIYGDLSQEQERQFQAKWAPLADWPSPPIVAYFNKLNPLLGQFLAARGAMFRTAVEFDRAWAEAQRAAGYDDERSARGALALAQNQRRALESQQALVANLVRQIQALGNPPDPVQDRCESAGRHRKAIAAVQELLAPFPLEGVWEADDGAVWVFRQMATLPDGRILAVATPTLATAKMFDSVWWLEPQPDGSFFEFYQPIFACGWLFKPVGFDWELRKACDESHWVQTNRFEPRTWLEKIAYGGSTMLRPKKNFTPKFPEGWTWESLLKQTEGIEKLKAGTFEAWNKNKARFLPVLLSQKSTEPPPQTAAQPKPPAPPQPGPPKPEEPALNAKQDDIRFHEGNIRIIQDSLAKDQAELAGTGDPGPRAQLEFRILQQKSDLQAERDLIASIQTGVIVHNRSAFDDVAHEEFVANIGKEQRRMEAVMRAQTAAETLVSQLPWNEQDQAREFVQRQMRAALTTMDAAAARAVVSAVHEKVAGYYAGQQAKQDEKAAWANLGYEAASNIQKAADSASQVVSVFAPPPLAAAYQGFISYLEGGPVEGVTRAGRWCNTLTYAAVDAFKGFEQGGANGDLGEALSSAAWAGVKAFVIGKAFEYGMNRVSGTPASAEANIARPRPGNAPVTAAAYTEYRKLLKDGEDRVARLKTAWDDVRKAREAGASLEEMNRLQKELRETTALVHESPEAKSLLKKLQKDPSNSALVENYSKSLGEMHARAEKQFHEIMQANGWNQQQLREFRNAASGPSVGMDHDLGLIEQAWVVNGKFNPWLTKNGKPAAVLHWQEEGEKAWEKAYEQVTGRSAIRSWDNITTSKMAEAYADPAWLGDGARDIKTVIIGEIQSGKAQQAADVTTYKMWHMMNNPALSPMQALVETARGTAKDAETKLLPMLMKVTASGAKSSQALQQAQVHWKEITRILKEMGTHELDPVSADRQIRILTGGKSIPEVVQTMGGLLESLGKTVGK